MIADSPIVEEVRKRRCEISQQFGDDLLAYGRHLRDVQAKYSSRVVGQITVVQSTLYAEQEPGRSPE